MEEKIETKKPYSWGPLYETLQEMLRNGDELPDEGLKKGFELFHSLDKVETLEEIRKIIQEANLSRKEQLRLNSPCLDGIIDSCRKFNIGVYITLNCCLDTYMFYVEHKSIHIYMKMLCTIGNYDKLKYLIDKNYASKEYSSLFNNMEEACRYMHYDIVNLLIDYINKLQLPNLPEIYGNALAWILYRFHFPDTILPLEKNLDDYHDWRLVIDRLIDSGANLNVNSLEPLTRACEKNSIPIVKLLLEKGAIKLRPFSEYSKEVQELMRKN